MYSKEHVSYGSYGIRKLTRSLQFTLFWLKTHFEIYPPRYLSSTGKTLRIKFPKWYGQVNDCQSVWTQNTGLTHSFIFQNFVKRINKLNTRAQRNKNSLTSEEGTELRPLWDKCPSGIRTWKFPSPKSDLYHQPDLYHQTCRLWKEGLRVLKNWTL